MMIEYATTILATTLTLTGAPTAPLSSTNYPTEMVIQGPVAIDPKVRRPGHFWSNSRDSFRPNSVNSADLPLISEVAVMGAGFSNGVPEVDGPRAELRGGWIADGHELLLRIDVWRRWAPPDHIYLGDPTVRYPTTGDRDQLDSSFHVEIWIGNQNDGSLREFVISPGNFGRMSGPVGPHFQQWEPAFRQALEEACLRVDAPGPLSEPISFTVFLPESLTGMNPENAGCRKLQVAATLGASLVGETPAEPAAGWPRNSPIRPCDRGHLLPIRAVWNSATSIEERIVTQGPGRVGVVSPSATLLVIDDMEYRVTDRTRFEALPVTMRRVDFLPALLEPGMIIPEVHYHFRPELPDGAIHGATRTLDSALVDLPSFEARIAGVEPRLRRITFEPAHRPLALWVPPGTLIRHHDSAFPLEELEPGDRVYVSLLGPASSATVAAIDLAERSPRILHDEEAAARATATISIDSTSPDGRYVIRRVEYLNLSESEYRDDSYELVEVRTGKITGLPARGQFSFSRDGRYLLINDRYISNFSTVELIVLEGAGRSYPLSDLFDAALAKDPKIPRAVKEQGCPGNCYLEAAWHAGPGTTGSQLDLTYTAYRYYVPAGNRTLKVTYRHVIGTKSFVRKTLYFDEAWPE